jgi:branched-chain amino acid transport system permease protein
MVLTQGQITSITVSLAVISVFVTWLKFSNNGLRFRALAENPVEFALRGFNVRGMRLLAFALSGTITAVCGLVGANYNGFDLNGGLSILLLAVVASTIGGRLSFSGAAWGGLLLGIVRAGTVWFLGARWQEAVTFTLLMVFLLFMPNGLLGRDKRLEAAP